MSDASTIDPAWPGSRLRAVWASGGATVNSFLSIPSAFTAEVMSRAGWDSLTVDLQHGLQDVLSMVACFQGMQATGTVPLARLPANDPAIIGKVLDLGAAGVICPMIDGPDDVRALVDACRYPPAGRRSNGPTRAGLYHPPLAYQRAANDALIVLPMIETVAALESLESIAAVRGITGLYIGPTDLCLALGLEPRIDSDNPRVLEAYRRVVAAARANGIIACMHCSDPLYARRCIDMGFQFVTVGGDNSLMLKAATAAVSALRGA